MTHTTPQTSTPCRQAGRRIRSLAPRVPLGLLLVLLAASAAQAQVGAPGSADPAADKPKVFIDGAVPGRAEIESQIAFAAWTDDPEAADVRLSFELAPPGLILRFTGRGRFEGRNASLPVPLEPAEAPD